jgi:hypothetical protein
MRIKVTITYEYDIEPEDYPEPWETPTEMAQLDFDSDSAAIIQYAAEDLTLKAEEVKS